MGRIVDRSKEHLGPGDKAIGQARRMLRAAVKAVEAGGDPDGTGTSYYHIRAGEEGVPRDADWHQNRAPDITGEENLQTEEFRGEHRFSPALLCLGPGESRGSSY